MCFVKGIIKFMIEDHRDRDRTNDGKDRKEIIANENKYSNNII